MIHHILVEGEDYIEEGVVKRAGQPGRAVTNLGVEEMALKLRKAGYLVKETTE